MCKHQPFYCTTPILSGRRKTLLITRIELDGFKTFQDFKLELSPFQVIVGPNGAGKSNLFDALHLLTLLAGTDLRSAFQELRGDAVELFTTFPNGQAVNKMTLAVEMLVNRKVQDSWGAGSERLSCASCA
jgi:predicted ATPase